MAVNYPAQIDSTNIPTAVDNSTGISASIYNTLRTAVLRIEQELGVRPSASYGTVRGRLDFLELIITGGGIIFTHNYLRGLQGGSSTDGYYHLTSYEHTWLTDGYDDGYWKEIKGGTGQTSYATGDILYADNTNSLAKLSIGTDGYILTISGGLPIWQEHIIPITVHNDLTGIQGGSYIDGYYHLTSYEHTWLTDGYDDGYWKETKGGTGQISYTTGDILYSDGTNSLAKLSVGTDGYILTVSGGVPTWQTHPVSITSHNSLTGIQGGSYVDGYYHLTNSQHTWLTDGYSDGYWKTSKGGTGYTSFSLGDIVYGSNSNTLNKLPIGTDGYYLKVSSNIPSWAQITHNTLSGIQGGSVADGYYHITSTQHTWLTDGPTTGYWTASKGGTGQTTYSPGDLLYGNSGSGLNKLSVGTDGYFLKVSGLFPAWTQITHNTLSGIQGGSIADGYYHLTATQHTWLTDGPTTGYWKATKGGTDQSSYAVGDLLYADSTTTLRRLVIGTDGYCLKVSGTAPAWSILTHNTLSGLQGGSIADGYYHLTQSQQTWLVDGYTTGYWTYAKGGTGQTSYATGDLIYASGTNTLAKRTIGSTNQVLTVSGGVPSWASVQLNDTKAEYAARMGIGVGLIEAAGKTTFTNATLIATSSGGSNVTKLAYVGNGCVIASVDYKSTGSVGTPIYKSYDYGKTWTLKYSTAFNSVSYGASYCGGGYCFAYDDRLNQHIVSSNYGETWAAVAPATAPARMFAYCRCSSDIIVAIGDSVAGNKRIERSTNLGTSWSDVYAASSGVLLSVVYCGGGIVVAGGDQDGSGKNIFRSTDYGATWTGVTLSDDTTAGLVGDLCYCGNGIIVAATYSGSYGNRISKSTDYGVTWTSGKVLNAYAISCCYMGDGRVLVGCGGASTGGRIYESTDYGDTFTSLGDLMPTFSIGTKYITSLIKLDNGTVLMGCNENYVCFSDESVSTEIPTDETVGGTGNSTYTTGDVLYASAANTLSKLAIGTDGYYLKVNSTIPAWTRLTHDGLASISGGSGADGYYHLTATQHTWLTAGPTTGYWTAAKGGTGFSSFSTGDLLYGSGSSLSKLTAGADGYILTMSGTSPAWKPFAEVRWQPLGTSDFTHTAVSNQIINVSNYHSLLDLTRATTITGTPVRIFTPPDGYCALVNDGYPMLSISGSSITGVTNTTLNGHGLIYITIANDGGGNYVITLYNDKSCSTASKLAHTASFSTVGSKALIEDSSSGVGGTISVIGLSGTSDSDIYIECFKWYVVTAFDYATNNMTLAGPQLPTTSNVIQNVWIGTPEMVEQVDFFIAGNYATTASTTLLTSMMDQYFQWAKSPYRIVKYDGLSKIVSATPPKINVTVDTNKVCSANSNDGITMSASATWYSSSNNIIVDKNRVTIGSDLEITTTQGATISTLDSNLTVSITLVSE